jgi:hypothetical protein
MSKQGTAGKSKHVIVMIPQKLEIIRKLGIRESQRENMLHATLDHQLCDMVIVASSESA